MQNLRSHPRPAHSLVHRIKDHMPGNMRRAKFQRFEDIEELLSEPHIFLALADLDDDLEEMCYKYGSTKIC